MDNQRLHLALAALMLVCTPFVGASGSNDGICDGEVGGSPGGGPDGEGAGIFCDIITGPSTLTIKSVLTVGIGFCQTESTDIPLQCEGDAGDINGAGAASFGDATWTGQRQINVDVTLDTSTCTAATSPPCGFTVEICNDRDHDSTCTNILAQNDELFDTATSEGVVFGDCKDQKTDCANPNEASWEGCMNPGIFDPDDWEDDQIIIFIGAEVGPTVDFADFGGINPDNVTETILNITDFVQNSSADAQAAVAVGTFTIFVEDVGNPTGCLTTVPPPPDDEPVVCEADWTVGALDGSADNPFNGASCVVDGDCDSDYDGTGYVGGKTVTVTCTAFDACVDGVDVETLANLVQGATSVSAEIYCSTDPGVTPVASSLDNTANNYPVLDWGTKGDGTYTCVFKFVVMAAPYHAEAACRDKPEAPVVEAVQVACVIFVNVNGGPAPPGWSQSCSGTCPLPGNTGALVSGAILLDGGGTITSTVVGCGTSVSSAASPVLPVDVDVVQAPTTPGTWTLTAVVSGAPALGYGGGADP